MNRFLQYSTGKSLGTKSSDSIKIIDINFKNIDKSESSMFLLCSDGLSNEVRKEEMIEIVNKCKDFNEACEKLVDLAKSRGGKDNITVLLFGGEV